MFKTTSMKNPFVKASYTFAVRKVVEGKTEKLIPVCKEPGLFGVMKPWRPIVKIYDRYLVMDYEHPQGLTKRECEAHIKGFKKQMELDQQAALRLEEFEPVA